MKEDKSEEDDEMRAEYDLSKLKFIGRGIYAERYRAGVKFIINSDKDDFTENNDKDEQHGES